MLYYIDKFTQQTLHMCLTKADVNRGLLQD